MSLLDNKEKNKGFGAGLAGGVRGFFGGLQRGRGGDSPDLRMAGQSLDGGAKPEGKGMGLRGAVDIDRLPSLGGDAAGEEDVSDAEEDAFVPPLKETLQVAKPLQAGRAPLQANADSAAGAGAGMLFDTKLTSYVGKTAVAEVTGWPQVTPQEQAHLGLDCGWSAIPHPLKADRGGEDVHLVCRAGGTTMFGVFDGVGGWAELGVDPAEYARKLAQELEEQLQRDPTIASWQERPLLSMLEVPPPPPTHTHFPLAAARD